MPPRADPLIALARRVPALQRARGLLGAGAQRVRARAERVFGSLGLDRRPYDKLSDLVEAYRSDAPAELLLLGDSVSERVSRDDDDPTPLWRMIAHRLEPRRTHPVTNSAYHGEVFRGFCRSLARLPRRPQAVLMTANLRSFLPQWAARPNWQFEDEIACIERWRVDPAAGVPRIRPTQHTLTTSEQKAYDDHPVHCIGHDLRRVGDFVRRIEELRGGNRDDRWRAIFSFHYMQEVPVDAPRLLALREAADAVREVGVTPIVYVTPVNWEAGARHCGDAFNGVLARNVEVVRDVLGPCAPVDLSRALTAERFFHADEPTEHLNQRGRRDVADALADVVRQHLSP